ncbi:MAG: hypothetical protein SF029_17715 [bacterium]|nr:hypothetical protein [bacterium]
MLVGGFLFWRLVVALVGAFGTAYMHERSGRDVTMGGLIGLVVGGVGGMFFLMLLWLWLYYGGYGPVGRMYGVPRKRWYEWWN